MVKGYFPHGEDWRRKKAQEGMTLLVSIYPDIVCYCLSIYVSRQVTYHYCVLYYCQDIVYALFIYSLIDRKYRSAHMDLL